ncbi:PREDICTED: tyrosine-specific transport [Prunus dulcis]|uniref:PREDICTED: tyrosine-specific transport n=1 Tax=Prunus dulcis TaxID=3755 RepID=A0A5E4FEE6_PRUDU|nr:tyrosine-specific transport protein 2 [Prunus dulcis]VVA26503.1 PREDICTED: tyrosine-specific transport [Prunus dulcis]
MLHLRLRLRLPNPSKHNSFPPPPNNPNLITTTINPIFTASNHNPTHIAQSFRSYKTLAATTTTSANNGVSDKDNPTDFQEGEQGSSQHKSFWGAVSLIIGTAVGPGMLGLPAETIRSGPLPSTIAILVSWVYVISSIILIAELSFAAMEEDGVEEVSFTGLATKALGSHFGAFIAVVYACLSFALLVACVSGIGSIVSQLFPRMNLVMAHALFPLAAGLVIIFFPFNVIDAANRFLCLLMLFSITALVAIGLSVARTNLFASFGHASWSLPSILPAIPVTVLTLGFHVITPFICKIAGNTIAEARKAILIGGSVPLIMVLSWNLSVLGLSGANTTASSRDPISLLLSVNPSALSAVQGFAFSALATSLIGYAVSFPKQLLDTLELIGKINLKKQSYSEIQLGSEGNGFGGVGFAVYSGRHNLGNAGRVSFTSSGCSAASEAKLGSSINIIVMPLVLGVPVLIASFFRWTFSRALDFAGLYANCFLFGILPPAMAYIHQSRKKSRSSILPGGNGALLLLFGIAVILGIWH